MTIFTPPHILNSARWRDMRIGLLGGSFNPAHEGHVHISRIALNTLYLDAVWWVVTPQNPLKDKSTLLPYKTRFEMARKMADHPKIIVTDIENELGTNNTYQTVKKIKKYFPCTKFVWITGMDNALNLHKWNNWHDLLKETCMMHITRHPAVSLTKRCPQRLLSGHKHRILERGGLVPLDSNTTYWLLQKKMVNISSTEIRSKIDFKTNTYNIDALQTEQNNFAMEAIKV